MIHFHGTPITPLTALYELAGRSFCISYARPDDCERAHKIGENVMLDNGAFSIWKSGKNVDWSSYYDWADKWLDYPTTWAVIPDVIGGSDEDNDELIAKWPHGQKGAPVWHMHNPLDRLVHLTSEWGRVCVGSSAQYEVVMSESWQRRMDDAWNALARAHSRTPNLHMLRGMQCSGQRWPFASVDSTDIARNHSRPQNSPRTMADRWDAMQTPGKWIERPEQMELYA